MGDLAVTASASDPSVREVELSLASMPVGEYLIELVVAGPGAPVTEILGFRVTS